MIRCTLLLDCGRELSIGLGSPILVLDVYFPSWSLSTSCCLKIPLHISVCKLHFNWYFMYNGIFSTSTAILLSVIRRDVTTTALLLMTRLIQLLNRWIRSWMVLNSIEVALSILWHNYQLVLFIRTSCIVCISDWLLQISTWKSLKIIDQNPFLMFTSFCDLTDWRTRRSRMITLQDCSITWWRLLVVFVDAYLDHWVIWA